MCGRYVSPDDAAFEREWSHIPRLTNIFQSFNVAPSQKPPVLLNGDGELHFGRLTWGFQPHWSKRSWINARAETVFEKNAFRSSAQNQRCIVPVAGWYEWDRSTSPRQPYYHTRVDGRSFGLAGIYTVSEKLATANRLSFALLTTAANEWAEAVHDRMPVILHPRNYDAWLSSDTPHDEARAVLDERFDDGKFDVYPVSMFINKPANNSAECIKRIAV